MNQLNDLTPAVAMLTPDNLGNNTDLHRAVESAMAKLGALASAIYQPTDQQTLHLRISVGAARSFPDSIGSTTDISTITQALYHNMPQPLVDASVITAQVEADTDPNLWPPVDPRAECLPIAFPLMLLGRIYGVLVMYVGTDTNCSLEKLRDIETDCAEVALILQNEQLRNSIAIDMAYERSKRAKDLYDSVNQTIFGISLGAQTALSVANAYPAELKQPLSFILTFAEAAVTEMRALMFELTPHAVIEQGLACAIQVQTSAVAAHHQIETTIRVCDEPMLSDHRKQALYQIFLEAIQNCVKHARAQHLWVSMHAHNNVLCLTMIDDGIGFVMPTHASDGITHMQTLARQAHATIDIGSRPGSGTHIQVCIPL